MSAVCAGCAKVAAALAGQEPALIAVLDHSVVLLGDHQAYPGYVVVWSRAHARELHHLSDAAYAGFHRDLGRVCAAVERAAQPWKLNLASLGNVVPHAHVHVFPRQADDPRRLEHPWTHADQFGHAGDAGQRAAMQAAIRAALAAQPAGGAA